MEGHRSLSRLGICDASLQLLYAKLKGGDVAGYRAQGLAIEGPRRSLGTVCEDSPSLLASRKLVVGRRAGILTAGLFTGRAGRELSIALFTAVRWDSSQGSRAALSLPLHWKRKRRRQSTHLDLCSSTWQESVRSGSTGDVRTSALDDGHSHLEQADTGLDTRKRGVCEKLLRGIARANLEGPELAVEELKDTNGEPRRNRGRLFLWRLLTGCGRRSRDDLATEEAAD